MWSVKALDGQNKGKVVFHADRVWIQNATPKVSEAGRQRVIREQCKNVHAGIVGELASLGNVVHRIDGLSASECILTHDQITPVFESIDNSVSASLYYNPYKVDGFVYKNSGKPFVGSKLVWLKNDRSVVSFEEQ